MLTTQQIRDEGYELNERGTIVSPGKFEGEQAYVVAFYDEMLNGAAEEIMDGDTCVSVLQIETSDAVEFPTLADCVGKSILLWETDQGFVYHRIMTAEQVAKFEESCESDLSDDES